MVTCLLCLWVFTVYGGEPMDTVKEVANLPWTPYSLFALTIIAFAWLYNTKLHKTSEAHQELVEARAALMEAQTENRKEARDKQLQEMRAEYQRRDDQLESSIKSMEKVADTINTNLEKHLRDHDVHDMEYKKIMTSIEQRLRSVESNLVTRERFEWLTQKLNDTDRAVMKAVTILEERFK